MKVLMIVTEKLPVPPVRGGAIQTYVAAVAPLVAKGHSLTILGVTDPSLPDRETTGGVTYVRVPGGDLDTYLENVTAFLGSNTFDLIHIFNRPRVVAPVRAAAPNARLVLSLHNDMFEPFKIDPDAAKAAIAAVERIVTVSDYVGKRVAELYPEAAPKLRTIYSGVDLDRFSLSGSGQAKSVRNELRRQHGLEGKKVILFVGRLSPKKGADVLVRAMPLVARKHPDAALVLVGSKWYGEDKVSDYVGYVRALAARAPLPVVTTGYVPADQVHQWFWAGDIFVCASLWEEPLARVHYEAMAAGLPIITTARGGNPEVVAGKGNGLVVDRPEDPAAFADAISRLLSDSSGRASMGSAGRSMAQQSFGWDRVAKEILSVWS
ncbi:MAG TPA: glycosyltransferase family 4 protein [Symbiobacteriaceae bacterium]|nr:glycosyltransferase family 4 protein [Symbiobacteriaceae bacterium]